MDARVKETITNSLEKLNIPNKDDIEKLEKKVQNLSARIAKLEACAEKGVASEP
jgi:polyhydroxyalkanoate synthesis regulator phasin